MSVCHSVWINVYSPTCCQLYQIKSFWHK